MKRREFIAIVGGAIAWPIEGLSQQASRTHRVAYLALAGTDDSTFIKERFKELGYKEGENLIFDLRSAHGQLETLGELASELVKNNPDVIITGFGTATAKAAQVATRTIPVVFSNVGDPIGSGVVQSLSRPGANVTGLAGQAAELSGKRLELLGQFVPDIHTVAVLEEPAAPFTMVALPQLRKAAEARGQQLAICDARSAGEVENSLAAAAKAGAGGVVVLETPVLIALRQRIVDVAATLRLPAIYSVRDFVDIGGFLSYGPDARQLYRRAAELADKILKGEKPAEIPVEQPTRFNLIFNLNAAKALGLAIPATLLALADEVIE
jgi:putative ABC transport system substrate-binding protein